MDSEEVGLMEIKTYTYFVSYFVQTVRNSQYILKGANSAFVDVMDLVSSPEDVANIGRRIAEASRIRPDEVVTIFNWEFLRVNHFNVAEEEE